MKKLEFKRDPLVIIPYVLFTLALIALVALKTITWGQFLGGLAALNLPAVFGLARAAGGSESDPPPPPKTPGDGRGLTSIVLLIGAGALFAHLAACGYGATACKVVDVAHANCDLWIRYLEADGTTREVRLTREEATELARATAKKKALEPRDGGAP